MIETRTARWQVGDRAIVLPANVYDQVGRNVGKPAEFAGCYGHVTGANNGIITIMLEGNIHGTGIPAVAPPGVDWAFLEEELDHAD